MRNVLIASAACLALASCQTTPEGEAKTRAAIQAACNGASYVQALLTPWRAAGKLNVKTERLVVAAEDALFLPETGLCVSTQDQNLTGVLVRISNFALTLSIALSEAKR